MFRALEPGGPGEGVRLMFEVDHVRQPHEGVPTSFQEPNIRGYDLVPAFNLDLGEMYSGWDL